MTQPHHSELPDVVSRRFFNFKFHIEWMTVEGWSFSSGRLEFRNSPAISLGGDADRAAFGSRSCLAFGSTSTRHGSSD